MSAKTDFSNPERAKLIYRIQGLDKKHVWALDAASGKNEQQRDQEGIAMDAWRELRGIAIDALNAAFVLPSDSVVP